MKKNFINFLDAKQFYNKCIRKDIEAYLIEDHENDVYSVVDEEVYNHLYFEFGLHMTLLEGAHW